MFAVVTGSCPRDALGQPARPRLHTGGRLPRFRLVLVSRLGRLRDVPACHGRDHRATGQRRAACDRRSRDHAAGCRRRPPVRRRRRRRRRVDLHGRRRPAHGSVSGSTYTPVRATAARTRSLSGASDGALSDDGVVEITVTPVNRGSGRCGRCSRDRRGHAGGSSRSPRPTPTATRSPSPSRPGRRTARCPAPARRDVHAGRRTTTAPDSFTFTASDGVARLERRDRDAHRPARRTRRVPRALASASTDEDIAARRHPCAPPTSTAARSRFTIVDGPAHGALTGTGAARAYTPDRELSRTRFVYLPGRETARSTPNSPPSRSSFARSTTRRRALPWSSPSTRACPARSRRRAPTSTATP